MIRLSVMYPASPGSRFNCDDYLGPHLELARRLLSSRGLVPTEIDRGIVADERNYTDVPSLLQISQVFE